MLIHSKIPRHGDISNGLQAAKLLQQNLRVEERRTGRRMVLIVHRGDIHADNTDPSKNRTTGQCRSDRMIFVDIAAVWCGPQCQV